MPRWTEESSAPLELQRRWRDYYAALKRHEDGHIQHGRELALLVKERLMGLGAVPCDPVSQPLPRESSTPLRQPQRARSRVRRLDESWGNAGRSVPMNRSGSKSNAYYVNQLSH